MKTEGETKHGIIANLLVRGGIVDAASLDRAVQIQTSKGGTLGSVRGSMRRCTSAARRSCDCTA